MVRAQQVVLQKHWFKKKNILNSCPTQGRVEGWDAMKPRVYRSVSSKGAGRPRLTHHHKGWWNGTKWMRWVWINSGMKFVVGENGRNHAKNLPTPRFVHHETHMEGPRRELGTPAVGGERLTACATRPPNIIILLRIDYDSHRSFHFGRTVLNTVISPLSSTRWN